MKFITTFALLCNNLNTQPKCPKTSLWLSSAFLFWSGRGLVFDWSRTGHGLVLPGNDQFKNFARAVHV